MSEPNDAKRTVPTPTLLTSPDPTPTRQPTPDPDEESALVGRYRLEEEVGRGGMGVVYRALDPDLGRTLAVKLLLPEHRRNAELGRRFLEEARLTGQLQHPAIPPVHEVGTVADGRPFFSMKLVQGQTLTQLLKARTTGELPRLLGVFAAVCQAIGYAHSRGVIHRDLKPGNVMVGAFGEVQVMDWGLAKVISRSGEPQATSPDATEVSTIYSTRGESPDAATRAGTVLGTPAYMAPEQARGEAVDARADVFGLGAILCVLLTGKPPFAGRDTDGVRRQAERADLAEALGRLEGCGADAELVGLAKSCLAAKAEDRPADGGAVAEAMARYQAGVAERLRGAELAQARAEEREAAERKRRKLTAALAGAALLVLALLGGAGWYVQRQAEAEVTRSKTDEALARLETEAAIEQAAALRDRGLWDNAEAVLKRVEQRPQALGLADVLAQVEQARADLALARELDRIRQDKALIVEGKLNEEGAPAAYEAALKRHGLDVLHGNEDDVLSRISRSTVKEAILAALDEWAFLETDKVKRARLLAVARRADPGEWSDKLRDADWRNTEALRRLAREVDPARLSPSLAEMLARGLGRSSPLSVPLLQEAWRHRPGDFWLTFNLANGLQYGRPPKLDEAIGYYRAALAVRPTALAVHNNLGNALETRGDRDEAMKSYNAALALNPRTPVVHNNIGRVLAARNDLDGAIARFQKAIDLDPKYARAHGNLGNALRAKGDHDGAIRYDRAAVALDPRDAQAHFNLARALDRKGDPDGAIASYREAIKLKPDYVQAHYNLGNLLRARDDLDGAIESYRAATRADPKFAMPHNNLASALAMKGDLDGAVASYRAALVADPKHALAHVGLGLALRDRGELDESLRMLREGHRLGSAEPGWTAPSARWIQECERSIALAAKLPAVLDGREKPRDAAETVALASLCRNPFERRYAAAVRLYAEVFASRPLPPSRPSPTRYLAACAAAMAGAGQGREVLPDKLRDQCRRQALAWLNEELKGWRTVQAAGQAKDRPLLRQQLQRWQQDRELASVRDEAALEELPAPERDTWRNLWADVAALRAAADGK